MKANKKIKILFVEDLPEDAEIARRAIKREIKNFSDTTVETKEEFIKALSNFKPDVIVSDYSMPVFNGLTALKITRSRKEFIPFILFTGSVNEQTAVKCMKEGADDYIIKDNITRLPFAVKEALQKKRSFLVQEKQNIELQEKTDELKKQLEKAEELRIANLVILNDLNNTTKELKTEITERKNAEEEIKHKERDLRSMIENPAGYVMYRTRLNRDTGQIEVVQVSPSFTDILGISEKDKNNFQKWFSYVHPEDLPALMKANEEGMKPPFKLALEVRYNHPKEGLKWIEIHANGIPYEDNPNLIEYANGIILDITKRKKNEEERKKSDERFRIAQDMSPDGFTILKPIRNKQGLHHPCIPSSTASYYPETF